jgi:hypothetical protein
MDGVQKRSTEQVRQVMAQAKAEIAAHLTPDQRTKFDEMEKERRERSGKSRNKDKDRRAGDKPPGTNDWGSSGEQSLKAKAPNANE